MASSRPSERLLKYPPMERQDLNQSQLGSFKFTPVDSIPSFPMLTTNYLQQQLAESFARVTANSTSRPPTKVPSAAKPRTVNNGPQQVGATDADFFNKHIKHDLGDSRLRLGPAALRSAVEGAATSPVKADNKNMFWIAQQGLDSGNFTHRPSSSRDVSKDFPPSIASPLTARFFSSHEIQLTARAATGHILFTVSLPIPQPKHGSNSGFIHPGGFFLQPWSP